MANLPAHEKFLRFETLPNTTQLMRARAVYMTGIAFIATQLVNIFFMTISYGEWTFDHSLSVAASIGVAATILSLRFTKNFHVYALIYSVMLFAGIGMSASVESTGINSALLPLIIVGAILNGFVGGWRHIIIYGVAALGFIWSLHGMSSKVLVSAVVIDQEATTRIFQRAMQASLALFMTSICTGLIVYTVTRLFNELDLALSNLNRSNQQKTDFLAHMSQELGRPVIGVKNGLKKLSEQNLNQDEKNYTHIIQTYARRLSHIIADVTVLSQLDKQKFVLKNEPFNLRNEVKGLIKTYEPIAARKGIHLGTTYAAQLPEAYVGDSRRVRQILKNLIHNAFKNTQAGSVHVYVDGRLKGADEVQLRISVKDTGEGIADNDIPFVFDRFSVNSVDNSQAKFSGTGLELSLSYELAMFMGGELIVESQRDVGSNFELNLTLHVAQIQAPHVTGTDHGKAQLETPGSSSVAGQAA